jgi:hypothetical protein
MLINLGTVPKILTSLDAALDVLGLLAVAGVVFSPHVILADFGAVLAEVRILVPLADVAFLAYAVTSISAILWEWTGPRRAPPV